MKKKFRIEGTVETVPERKSERKSSGIDLDTIMYRSLESLEAENDLKEYEESRDNIDPDEFIKRIYSLNE